MNEAPPVTLTASGFRTPGDDLAPLRIRDMNTAPLVLVAASGTVIYANNPTAKDTLLKRFREGTDLLLWAWPGQWRTDMFVLTRADLAKHYGSKVPAPSEES
jgi:hypothetical protein